MTASDSKVKRTDQIVTALKQRQAGGGRLVPTSQEGLRLVVPAGAGDHYRWVQLDDYMELRRKEFRWHVPARMEMRARVSDTDIPGTWGFGYWNDPFSAGIGLGGMTRRLPSLPQTAWFFYASAPNYLSLRDDLPARGLLAATFRSSKAANFLLPVAVLAVPGLLARPTRRLLRRLARAFVHQDARRIETDPTEWHTYGLEWQAQAVRFHVDGREIWDTEVSPHGPLGFVLWIDNQYAAFTPEGELSFGTLANPREAWLEVDFRFAILD